MVSAAVRPRVAGLVLAAGGSRRFGAPKQLAPLGGRPLLEHALAAIAAVPELDRVAVTLGADAQEILAHADLHGARPVLVSDWSEGVAASLRAGVAALAAHVDAVVVTLGDQPCVTTAVIAELAAQSRYPGRAARATFDGRPGHPVLLPARLFPAVAALRGDRGVGDRLVAAGVVDIPCDEGVVQDVDTPAQLLALAAAPRPR